MLELLVAITILCFIVVLLASMLDSMRRVSGQTIPKIEAFRESRRAFETLAGRLSQATLNTYLDYVDNSGNYRFTTSGGAGVFVPARYTRTSDLRFVSGDNLAGAASGSPSRPTHGIFFQAPLGIVDAANSYGGLENLLNSLGYYIEFRDDSASRPDFFSSLNPVPPAKYRFRLIEAVQPSEKLTVYNYTGANPGLKSTDANGLNWMSDTISSSSRVLADNLIALIVFPTLGTSDTQAGYEEYSLAPSYSYDSTVGKSDPVLNSKNQLPPLVKVTLVAVDERSYSRSTDNSATPPELGLNGLFHDAKNYQSDIETLERTLQTKKIDYRIFTTTVTLKSARWSRAQAD